MNKRIETHDPRPTFTAKQAERTITDNLPTIDHHGEVDGEAEPCAHVTSTYRVSRRAR